MWKMSDTTPCRNLAWQGLRGCFPACRRPEPRGSRDTWGVSRDRSCRPTVPCRIESSGHRPRKASPRRLRPLPCLSSTTSPRASGINGLQAAGQIAVRIRRQRFDKVLSRKSGATTHKHLILKAVLGLPRAGRGPGTAIASTPADRCYRRSSRCARKHEDVNAFTASWTTRWHHRYVP